MWLIKSEHKVACHTPDLSVLPQTCPCSVVTVPHTCVSPGRHVQPGSPSFLSGPPQPPGAAALTLIKEKEWRDCVCSCPLPAAQRPGYRPPPSPPPASSSAYACAPSFQAARRQIEKDFWLPYPTPKHILVEGKCAFGVILPQAG